MDNQEIVCRVNNAKARSAQAHFGQFRVKRSLSNSWFRITKADNGAVIKFSKKRALHDLKVHKPTKTIYRDFHM
ncbi:hypothetical protein [Providencia vermicola]|uniref:hypothetical protein n=1 Tax=Providencia vermicola TaxID=333965 RepID=UPI0034E3F321